MTWPKEHTEFLEEKWGVLSIKTIADKLGYSIAAVRRKAVRMNLGDAILHFDGITVNHLAKLLDLQPTTLERFKKTHGMPVTTKVFAEKLKVKVIRIEDFWKWLENNKEVINLYKLEPLVLGKEPLWVDEKRKNDYYHFIDRKQNRWTKEEIERLKQLLSTFRYSYQDLAKIFNRSEESIRMKLCRLKVKERPIKK